MVKTPLEYKKNIIQEYCGSESVLCIAVSDCDLKHYNRIQSPKKSQSETLIKKGLPLSQGLPAVLWAGPVSSNTVHSPPCSHTYTCRVIYCAFREFSIIFKAFYASYDAIFVFFSNYSIFYPTDTPYFFFDSSYLLWCK